MYLQIADPLMEAVRTVLVGGRDSLRISTVCLACEGAHETASRQHRRVCISQLLKNGSNRNDGIPRLVSQS